LTLGFARWAPTTPETLTSRNNLAMPTGGGPHRRGRHLARAGPSRPGTLLGPDHPVAVTARQPRQRLPGRSPHQRG